MCGKELRSERVLTEAFHLQITVKYGSGPLGALPSELGTF